MLFKADGWAGKYDRREKYLTQGFFFIIKQIYIYVWVMVSVNSHQSLFECLKRDMEGKKMNTHGV